MTASEKGRKTGRRITHTDIDIMIIVILIMNLKNEFYTTNMFFIMKSLYKVNGEGKCCHAQPTKYISYIGACVPYWSNFS